MTSESLAHELWAASQLSSGEGIENAVYRIAEILSQQAPSAVPGWTSVDERLPEKYTEVLVWPHPSDQTMTAQYGLMKSAPGHGWVYAEYQSNHGWEENKCHPTHWMPLPAAPKERK